MSIMPQLKQDPKLRKKIFQITQNESQVFS